MTTTSADPRMAKVSTVIAEMDELALQFAAYYGCAKADYLNQVIGEQKQRVLAEN